MEKRMKKEKSMNETELKETLRHIWHKISKDVTKRSIDSVPNRLNEVKKVNGHPTRY